MIFTADEIEQSRRVFAAEAAIRQEMRRVWIFGAGRVGAWLREFIAQAGFNVAGIIDNNSVLWGATLEGRPVVSLKDYAATIREDGDLVVLGVGGKALEEVERQCRDAGVKAWRFYQAMAILRIGCFSDPMDAAEVEADVGAREALDIWADEESRGKYVRFVKFHALRDPAFFHANEGEQYFLPKYMPKRFLAYFADIGAYIGDTLDTFMEHTGGEFAGYHAFEPDPVMFAELAKSPQARDPRVRLHNIAIGEEAGTVRMTRCAASASTRDAAGDMEVRMDTLEHALAGDPVTLVKMDIEGGEPFALAGARSVIEKQRPALAISVYHRVDHFWRLPLWIRRLDLGYKLRLGCHSDIYNEVVCYAIPG